MDDIWYSPHELLTRNPMIGYVTGGRGCGKTFGFKEWVVERSEDPNRLFMWVRRYTTELKKAKKDFLGDLAGEGKLPEGNWEVKGDRVLCDGKVRGFFVALSKATSEKSAVYRAVDTIIFDEALLPPGFHRYIPNEVEALLELIETVNRIRTGEDGRQEVRCFCLANKVSYVNPHFAYWGIVATPERFTWAPGKKGLVIVEDYKNERFTEVKRQTRMGRLIDGTSYGSYSIDNEAWFDDSAFIEPRPRGTKCVMNLKNMGATFGVWIVPKDGSVAWVCRKSDMTKETFTCNQSDHDENTVMMNTRYPTKKLRLMYEEGKLRFEDTVCKAALVAMLQKASGLKR